MRHRKKFKIGKGNNHRKKLLRSLGSSFVLYEKITTTFKNARAVRSYIERLITKAKNNSLATRRIILGKLSPMATKKILEVFGQKFKDRKGGYTRLTKIQHNLSGNSKAILEFVE